MSIPVLNIFILQTHCGRPCTIICSVVVYEEEVRNHSTSEQTHVRQENCDTLADTSDWSSFEDEEIRATANRKLQHFQNDPF